MCSWRRPVDVEWGPALTDALIALRWVSAVDLPMLAAHWLVRGHDGPALRELAGLSSKHVADIEDAWVTARDELGVDMTWPSRRRLATAFFAREVLAERVSLHEMCRLITPWQFDREEPDDDADNVIFLLDDVEEALVESLRHPGRYDLTHDQIAALGRRALEALAAGDLTAGLRVLRPAR